MYLKDLDCRVCVRLSQDDVSFLTKLAKEYNLTLSKMIRQLLFSYRVHYKGTENEHNKTI